MSTNPHQALGTQNDMDPYKVHVKQNVSEYVEPIKTAKIRSYIRLGPQSVFPEGALPSGSYVNSKNPDSTIPTNHASPNGKRTHLGNVFFPNESMGTSTPSGNLFYSRDDIKEILRFNLNSAFNTCDVSINGGSPFLNTNGTNSVNGFTNNRKVGNGWWIHAMYYKHYKVEKTHVKLTLTHVGSAANRNNNAPFQIYGMRHNTYLEVDDANQPVTVQDIMEHPHGFKASGPIFPTFIGQKVPISLQQSAPDDGNAKGTNSWTWSYTYDADDALAEADINGVLANKSLWSKTRGADVDVAPKEPQTLTLYASPLVHACYDKDSSESDVEIHRDALVIGELEITQIISFRDPILGKNVMGHDVIGMTEPNQPI